MPRRTIAVTGLAVLCFSACGNSPESTVKNFHRAIERGNAEQALSYMSAPLRALLPAEKMQAAIKDEAAKIKGCGGIKDIVVTLSGDSEKQTGSSQVLYSGSCDPSSTKDLVLVKEDGQWKLGLNK